MTRPPIIAVANQKGGVGKTTTAVSLAAGLAQGDDRVLLVDLDPQGNASTALGVHRRGRGTYDAVVDGVPVVELVVPTVDDRIDCVPASLDLAGAEVELVSAEGREYQLARVLGRARPGDVEDPAVYPRGYTAIVLDCPPSLGLLTVNALAAADSVLIPVQCEYFALDGLTHLLRTVSLVREHLQPDLGVLGLLLTMYEVGSPVSAQVAEEVRAYFGALVLDPVIPRARVGDASAPRGVAGAVTGGPDSNPVAVAYERAARQLARRLAVDATRQARREQSGHAPGAPAAQAVSL